VVVPLGDGVTRGGGDVVVAVGGRPEHQVVEQIDLCTDAQVVGDDERRLDTQAHVGAGVGVVAAADVRLGGVVVAAGPRLRLGAQGRAVLEPLHVAVVVVCGPREH